jgi:hypothetical protein
MMDLWQREIGSETMTYVRDWEWYQSRRSVCNIIWDGLDISNEDPRRHWFVSGRAAVVPLGSAEPNYFLVLLWCIQST